MQAKYEEQAEQTGGITWPTDIALPLVAPAGCSASQTQERRHALFFAVGLAAQMLLFQVGFTNSVAIGLWTPAVILSLAVSGAAMRLRGGPPTVLGWWMVLISLSFQLTIMLGITRCLGLEGTGGRSFVITGTASVAALLCGLPTTAAIAHAIVHLALYLIIAVVDAEANCSFDTESSNVSSMPRLAVIVLFQLVVPVVFAVAAALRVGLHYRGCAAQQRLSEELGRQCIRAALQHDIGALVAAVGAFDDANPPAPSITDDALITVVNCLRTLSSAPTITPPQEDPQSRSGHVTRVSSMRQLVSIQADDDLTQEQDLQNIAKRRRASRVGSVMLEPPSPNSRSLNGTSPPPSPHLSKGCSVLTLFALPRLGSYLTSSLSSVDLAQMFVVEFAEAVTKVLAVWHGSILYQGPNRIVARFSTPMAAVAAQTHLHTLLLEQSHHHKDSTLNMMSGHRPLTVTVAGDVVFGCPVKGSAWGFGYSQLDKIFDTAVDAFGSYETVPANLVASSLLPYLAEQFEVVPSTVHPSVMVVRRAMEGSPDGTPVIDPEVFADADCPTEAPELPVFEVAAPPQTADGGRPPMKGRSLFRRPQSGNRATTAPSRKQLPPHVVEVWNTIDVDQNGYLDLSELQTLIKKIGLPMTKSEVREFFGKVDTDSSGTINFDEFEVAYHSSSLGGASVMCSIRRAAMVMSHSNEKEFISLVDKSWRKYDRDGSGRLEEVEVGRILRDLGMNYSSEEVKWMFQRLDKDRSGFVEFDEFMNLFSGETSEFTAIRERIQAVSRVMVNKSSTSTFSTPDQLDRDQKVTVLEFIDTYASPFIFFYIWYVCASVSFNVALGDDIIKSNDVNSIIDIILDALYAIWCISKAVYLPKENSGRVIFKDIFKHHVCTVEFYVDMITIVPADIIFFALGAPVNTGLIAYFRLNKLLSVYHLDSRYKFFSQAINPAVARAMNALLMFFVFCHILCCCVVIMTRQLGDESVNELMNVPGILHNEAIRYVVPFYWSILTLAGQLNGAAIPTAEPQVVLLLVAVIFGLPLYTVVLGTVGNAVNVETSYTRYLDKIDTLRSFFAYAKINKDFENDIISYYRHLYTTTNTLDIEENPLDDLPVELSIPLTIAMGRDMLKNVPIFKGASSNLEFVHELTTKLVPKVIEPHAVVMRKGEVGTEMYFITFGNFNIVVEDKVVFTLGKGNFFGEIALLHSGKRTATIVNSHRFGNVLMLDKEPFQEVARFFPDCLSQVYKAAEDRIKQMKDKEKEEKEAAAAAAKSPERRISEVSEAKSESIDNGPGPSSDVGGDSIHTRDEAERRRTVDSVRLADLGAGIAARTHFQEVFPNTTDGDDEFPAGPEDSIHNDTESSASTPRNVRRAVTVSDQVSPALQPHHSISSPLIPER